MTETGELDRGDLDAVDAEVAALIDKAVAKAKAAPLPTEARPAHRRLRALLRRRLAMARNITYSEALNEALAQEMERDESVIVDGRGQRRRRGSARRGRTPGAACSA